MKLKLIKKCIFSFGIPSFIIMAMSLSASADTAIEVETAQIGKHGDIAISQSYQYARAKDGGTSGETLSQFEYGLSDNAELLIEPFFYTWDHPKDEPKVEGLGDLEITPSYKFIQEDGAIPAVLAAFKLKVPTGSQKAGSSGKFDYLPYFIIGQHYGGFTFNANLGANFATPDVGQSPLKRTFTWAIEAQREISPNLVMFLEGFSTEDHVKTISDALEYEWTEHVNTFAVYSYTEEHESIFRLGFNLEFGSDKAEP